MTDYKIAPLTWLRTKFAELNHTHTINLNSSNVYNADNWTTIDGNAPTITSDSIQANAVSHHILNKEFLKSKHYTLTFEFNIGSNRGGFYLFGDKDCNMLFEITTDIGNTITLQHDSNGNTTELYVGTKNHFTSGWHDIKVIRKGDTAIVYIDDELYYTFNNIGNATNIFGLLKWSSGSATIKNIDVSLDITELPIEDYIKKDSLKTIEGVNLVGNEDIAIDVSCGYTTIYESDMTSDDGNWVKSSSSGMTVTYDSDGLTVLGTTTVDRYYSLNMSSLSIPSTDIRVECDIIGYVIGAYNNSTELVVCNSKLVFDSNNGQKLVLKAMTNNDVNVASMNIPSTPIAVKVEVGTSTINVYINNTLFGSVSTNNSYQSIALKTYNQRSMTIKNIKIYSDEGSGSENTIYLGDDIMIMIDTALGHMITNWEDYD